MEIRADEIIGNIGEVLTESQKKRGILIHAFHKIQEEHNYLPEDVLKRLSEELDISLSEVYSVASFYKQFYFKPRGRNIVCACVGTACHVRGAKEVVGRLENAFGIKAGETTEDMSVTLETVGCVGCCGLAPVVVVNNEFIGELTPSKTDTIIESIKQDPYGKTG
jgi:NADH:ubiquinone oxidoreductase subunit E